MNQNRKKNNFLSEVFFGKIIIYYFIINLAVEIRHKAEDLRKVKLFEKHNVENYFFLAGQYFDENKYALIQGKNFEIIHEIKVKYLIEGMHKRPPSPNFLLFLLDCLIQTHFEEGGSVGPWRYCCHTIKFELCITALMGPWKGSG